MSIPYPTNHARVADTPPDFEAIYRNVLQGRAAERETDNPYLFRTAEWIAWQYGFNTRDAGRVAP